MTSSISIRTVDSENVRPGTGVGGVGGVVEKKLRKSGSFLNKFTSLGGLKTPGRPRRTVSDFHIKLDEPHRHFQPGEFVKGCVCVTVEKEFRLTHLVVNLKGKVELYNGPTGGGVHTKRDKGTHALDTLDEETSRLCWDEQVLCGDGGLKPGVYQFQFVMLLPGKGLPSSLNFEKGKIEYKIMATITRPTAMGATLSCERDFSVMENIDVARLSPPSAKVIGLEKKVKAKQETSKDSASAQVNPSITSLFRPPSPPLPPSPIALPVKVKAPKPKRIQATVSLQQGGCLRGENLSVNIKVQHTKPIKSLCGVIVTLYRLGSFDRLPLMPSYKHKNKEKAKKGTVSSSTVTSFRKEISQKMLPLIIDPSTLTWAGTAKVRVPEDSFPTITSVPLGIVSFRYFVEVVIDLGGKVSQREELFVPVNNQPTLPQMVAVTSIDSPTSHPPQTIIETDRIRREKNVKSCRFEVTIGTIDSSTNRGHRIRTLDPNHHHHHHHLPPPSPTLPHPQPTEITLPEDPPTPDLAPEYTPHPSPPPLSEKDRLRTLEASILPSVPPISLPSSSSSAPPSAPPFEQSPLYSPPPAADSDPSEDKLELERRRLLELESAPPVEIETPAPTAPGLETGTLLYEAWLASAPAPSAPPIPAVGEEEQAIERQEGDVDLPVYSR